jgi:hypothetical protein
LQDTLFSSANDNGAGSILVVSCNIKNLRHKPGKRFMLSYQLELVNTRTGAWRNQLVSGSLCKVGLGQHVLESEGNKQSSAVYIAKLDMLAWVFPQDRKLIYLAQILDIHFLKSHLSGLLPLLGCSRLSQVADIQIDILQYLPERSCMMRYRLTIDDPVNASQIVKVIYGKNYRDDSGSGVYAVMQQLAQQLPKTAIPLGYDAQYRTLWQSHLSGFPLAWRDLETPKVSELLKNMADCVTRFQGCQITTTATYGFRDIDEQLFDTIKAAEPHDRLFTEQVTLWVATLIEQRMLLDCSETVIRPLHQDLHLCNFMVNENSVCLIDFDTVCLGDPLADIGSLIANFYRCGLYAGRAISCIDSLVNKFLRYYQEAITWEIDLPRLNWYIAAALVHEVIRRTLRQRQDVGLKHIPAHLELSKRYAGLATKEGVNV